MNSNHRYAYINGFALKIIAMISMTLDHVAVALFNNKEYSDIYNVLRNLGRIAFPIFCFLLVEGFMHTRDVKKYLIRLFVFGLISEVPFDLLIASSPGLYMSHQNIFFTLCIGLLGLCCIKQYENEPYMNIIIVIITSLIAYLLKTDYSYFGIIQIMLFYFMRNSTLFKIFSIAFLNAFMEQPAGAAALIFTSLYNGKRGPALKYPMYAYYPLHLLVLYLIKQYV